MSNGTEHQRGKVTITYNGGDRQFEYNPEELVSTLLERAKREFQVQNQHLLSLFTGGGVELNGIQNLSEVGVRPEEVLVLRQSTVKGGS